MTIIKDATFSEERALYNLHDATVKNCRFAGEEDGESAMKESGKLRVEDCYFDLRYPLWHVKGATLLRNVMTENCRAAIWYSSDISVFDCEMKGIKAVRECKNVTIENTDVVSPEFGWKSRNIRVTGGSIVSEYAFLLSENIVASGLKFQGKYSFQYVQNARFSRCRFDTKDAFWHTKNITVKDSIIKGEYLGWYSENLTLIRCKIIGTQPLCYCKGMKLVDCTTEECDLSFEYSDVNASISGGIVSVKNPKSGKIVADSIGKIILKNSVIKCKAKILVRTAKDKTKNKAKDKEKGGKNAVKSAAEKKSGEIKGKDGE